MERAQAGGDIKQFTVSPSIIRHLIESQAGSVEKAVLEAVMNGIDARASRVDIEFAGTGGIVISDDGHGFRSRADIEKHFAVFGFDHDTDDERKRGRSLGRFGLGRGQLMAFAATKWETNRFRMDVDIRGKDLAFKLTESRRSLFDGCRITARLYEPMRNVAKQAAIDEIKRQTLYAPVAVYIDGKRVNKDPDDVAWTADTGEFRFLERPHAVRGVNIYNLGVFVRRYPHSRMGVSGDLVSKRNFKLNMARNDVIQSTCPMWKKALKLIGSYAARRQTRGRLDDNDRMAIIRNLLGGEYDPANWRGTPLIKLVNGRHADPDKLWCHAGGSVALAPSRHSQIGETVHRQKRAAVVAPDMLEWFGASDLDELLARMNRIWPIKFTAADFDSIAADYSSSHSLLPDKDLSKSDGAILDALRTMSSEMCWQLKRIHSKGIMPHEPGYRKAQLGASDTAQAWTDGRSCVTFDRVMAARLAAAGVAGFGTLAAIMLHEYMHDEPDDKTHAHGPGFYEAYEATMCDADFRMYDIVAGAYRKFANARAKAGLKMTKAVARRLDDIDEIGGEVPEPAELETRRAETRPKHPGLVRVDWLAEFDGRHLATCWAELVTRTAVYRTRRFASKAALQSEVRGVLRHNRTSGDWPDGVSRIRRRA